jgi:hypothetical protein
MNDFLFASFYGSLPLMGVLCSALETATIRRWLWLVPVGTILLAIGSTDGRVWE